jgi:ATP-dependent RNA helicase DeaD
MLDMGFAEDLEQILGATPDTRQTALFSATMPGRIKALAARYMTDPVTIRLAQAESQPGGESLVRQVSYVVHRAHKAAALGRILDVESPVATIVFCRTRVEVDQLTETMNGRGYTAESLHGGMDQGMRDRVMDRLRKQTADLLVATDVAARGLDVDHLTHVVNYDVPTAPEAYVHRIGRVGRAGRGGVAITLVEPRQHRLLKAIERHTGTTMEIEKVPTVADLRARQLELTRAAVRETLLEDDYEQVRAIVESLTDEFDVTRRPAT